MGSSQNSKTGFVRNSAANDNLFFSPPDNALPLFMSPILVWLHCIKPTFANVEFTSALFSCRPILLSSLRFAWWNAFLVFKWKFDKYHYFCEILWKLKKKNLSFLTTKVKCSKTVKVPSNKSSWWTNPLKRCMNGPTGRLSTIMSPFTIVPAEFRNIKPKKLYQALKLVNLCWFAANCKYHGNTHTCCERPMLTWEYSFQHH